MADRIARELAGPGWSYPWTLPDGRVAPVEGEVLRTQHTRAALIEGPVRAALAAAGPQASALELSCADGWLSQQLVGWGARRVLGADPDERNVRRAELMREIAGIGGERLAFRRLATAAADAGELGSFDVVVAIDAIGRLENPFAFARALARLTRRLLVVECDLARQLEPPTVWDRAEEPIVLDSVLGIAPRPDGIALVPNRAGLEAILREAGFEDVRIPRPRAHHERLHVQEARAIALASPAAVPPAGPQIGGDGQPLPPPELTRRLRVPRVDFVDVRRAASILGRSGWWDWADEARTFERAGGEVADQLRAALPAGALDGARMLDFDGGPGEVARHLLSEARAGELVACEADPEAVEWIGGELSPPVRTLRRPERPPLELGDGSFDVAWALSAFTSMVAGWSAWLLELHRLLRDGGLLLAGFLGAGCWSWLDADLGGWDERATGMLSLRDWRPREIGGPLVFHSQWWIREHWGRAFEIVSLRSDGLAMAPGRGAGLVVMRKRAVALEPDDLQRPAPGDEQRELAAERRRLALQRADELQVHAGREQELAIAGQESHDLQRALEAARAASAELGESRQ